MSALGKVVRSGVGRRRVQTVVIGLVVMIAVTAAVLGGSLMVASRAPFDRAFDQQQGAHLTAQFDAGKTTAAQLSASAHATGVTAAAGPFQTAVITPATSRGGPGGPITVVGRADPGGSVDAVTLTKGRWVTGPGEIVLQTDRPASAGLAAETGRRAPPAGPSRQPDPDRGRHGPVGQRDRRRLGGPRTGRDIDRRGRGRGLPDALPLRHRRHHRAGRRGPRRGAGERPVGCAGRNPVLAHHQNQQRSGNTVLLVPFLIAFGVLGVAHGGPDHRQRHRGRGQHRNPPDRHPQSPRVHPRPGGAGLHGPGPDPRRGRRRARRASPATC